MKLSNKILIILAGLLFFTVTIYRFKFDKLIEMVPFAGDNDNIETKIPFNSIKNVSVKGWFNVKIIKSDYNFIKLTGSGILIGYYLRNELKGDTVLIREKIDFSKYKANINVTIGLSELNSVELAGGAACLVNDITGKDIKLFATDSTVSVFAGCYFEKANIYADKGARISFSSAANGFVDLRDKSDLFINCGGGSFSGSVHEGASYLTAGEKKQDDVAVSRVNKEANGGKNEK
jgi:hypothetical protein